MVVEETIDDGVSDERASPSSRPPLVPVAALGLLTIVAYGACFYAYSVLIAPISADTGWPPAALGAIFSGVLLVAGVGGIFAGGLLDRVGEQPLFAVAATLGAGALLAAAYQTQVLLFALCYVLGCGVVGALGFYHVTQTVAARVAPGAPARAIIWLTLVGALAGPLYLPTTGWLCEAIGWRGTIKVDAASVAVAVVGTALLVRGCPTAPSVARRESALHGLRRSLRDTRMQTWFAATLIAGAAINALLLYQVPAMVRLGLPLSLAAALAGLRGAAQFAGRLPLGPVIARVGARRTIVSVLGITALATPFLLASDRLTVAIAFAFVVGAATGALWPLQGIYTHELAHPRHLGTLMGAQQALFAVGGAIGPVTAGVLLGATGSYVPIVVAVTGGLLLAGALLSRRFVPLLKPT